MSFQNLLDKTCTILQKAEAQTGTGEISISWSTKADNVKTRRAVQKAPAITLNNAPVTITGYTFYFAPDTDITEADRIVFDNETYEILLVAKDSSDHHLAVSANTLSFE